jgi:hypothetical protein
MFEDNPDRVELHLVIVVRPGVHSVVCLALGGNQEGVPERIRNTMRSWLSPLEAFH